MPNQDKNQIKLTPGDWDGLTAILQELADAISDRQFRDMAEHTVIEAIRSDLGGGPNLRALIRRLKVA